MTKKLWLALALAAMAMLIVACGGGDTDDEGTTDDNGTEGVGEATAPEDIEGSITILHQRTDINDTVFEQDYRQRFNEIYPNINLNFEAITDYQGQVQIRMNTQDYGDVLLIPEVTPSDFEHFFEPLGTVEELQEEYLFADETAFGGITYGLPIVVNANGIVYNTEVFEEAGITEIPATPEDFIAALQAIKENTDAIPLYTNYGDGWPLDQWEPNRLSIAGDEQFNNLLVDNDAPFAEGEPHYILYKLLYDAANQGLIENDPLTTDWELSKQMLADGEIGAMVLGSWAIVQMQETAEVSGYDPNIIGYMPFPYTQEDGKVYSVVGPDFSIGINVNSDQKEAARAWVEWFIHESGYAVDQGGIPPVVGGDYPETLAAFDELGVEFISEDPHREGEEGWLDDIDNLSEVGLWQPNFKQRIVEAAIGNRNESFDDIMDDLNSRWAPAREQIVNQ